MTSAKTSVTTTLAQLLASSLSLLAVMSSSCASSAPATTSLVQRFPDVEWLPLRGPPGVPTLEVVVLLDGRPTPALLDTGAETSSVSQELAERMNLRAILDDTSQKQRVLDAHGNVGEGWRTRLDTIALGRVWVDDVDVTVTPMGHELVLIGYDVLRRFDLVIVPDEAVVGLMPPGTAPHEGARLPVRLLDDHSALVVDASAPGSDDVARGAMILDTGASASMFPSAPAMLAGVPADRRFKALTVAVSSEREQPGRFALRPLTLGDVDVGHLLAFEGTSDDGSTGLLGLDVLRQYRTTIVSTAAAGGPQVLLQPLRRWPATMTCAQWQQTGIVRATSTRRLDDEIDSAIDVGDGGAGRKDATCLGVMVHDLSDAERVERAKDRQFSDDGLAYLMGRTTEVEPASRRFRERSDACLQVELHGRAVRERVQFVVVDEDNVLQGALLSVVATVDGASSSACVALPESTRLLGLTSSSSLSLVAVRADNDVDASLCERGVCSWYVGP